MLSEPYSHKRLNNCYLICAVIYNNDPVRPPVVGRGDGPKPLLAGRVPDLELDGLAVQIDGPNFEVHTDGADVALRVGVVCKPEQQT